MIRLRVERTIAAPPDEVFDWLVVPSNLTASRLVFTCRWVKGSSDPGVGAVRAATAVGIWLRERIVTYDPPRSYSYLIIRSFPPMVHDGGTLTFAPAADSTHVEWVTTYTIPKYAGGKMTEAVSAVLIRAGFSGILAGCAKALEPSGNFRYRQKSW